MSPAWQSHDLSSHVGKRCPFEDAAAPRNAENSRSAGPPRLVGDEYCILCVDAITQAARRLRREMQCTTTVRPEAEDWQPPTLGFNLQVNLPRAADVINFCSFAI